MTAVLRMCRFGDMDQIKLSPPAPVRTLVRAVLDTPDAGWSPDDGSKDEIAEFVTNLLVKQKGEMLGVYFGMRFDVETETLETLPELLDHYVPPLNLLPMFLLRLAIQVDWTSEDKCFQTIAKEFAEFYMVREGATTADALPRELRAYAAGAAAESDRGRSSQSQLSHLSQVLQSQTGGEGAAGDNAAKHRGEETAGEGGAAAPKVAVDQYGREGTAGKDGLGGIDGSTEVDGEHMRDMEMAIAGAKGGGGEWRWCVQHVLFPAMRYLVMPPRVSRPATSIVSFTRHTKSI